MIEGLDELRQKITSFSITSETSLEEFRLSFLSKKSELSSLLSKLGTIAKENRAEAGKMVNDLKNEANEIFQVAKAQLEAGKSTEFDISNDPGYPVQNLALGSHHIISQTLSELKSVFFRMGFTVADGPEIEDDFHNFTALNFPPEHPARDMQDTFFIRKDVQNPSNDQVLRTHTSPVQIRLMMEQKPPIRAIMPGRVYRNEAITAKSFCLFHQVEGLYINKGVTLAELKETLITTCKIMFGDDVKYRIRPSFFPFTEPSMEMDIWWEKDGKGQWMEILGAGMVDPNVLKAVDLDPEVYSGYAFGIGVERMALRKYGINDIRVLYENDARFLKQFA